MPFKIADDPETDYNDDGVHFMNGASYQNYVHASRTLSSR